MYLCFLQTDQMWLKHAGRGTVAREDPVCVAQAAPLPCAVFKIHFLAAKI